MSQWERKLVDTRPSGGGRLTIDRTSIHVAFEWVVLRSQVPGESAWRVPPCNSVEGPSHLCELLEGRNEVSM